MNHGNRREDIRERIKSARVRKEEQSKSDAKGLSNFIDTPRVFYPDSQSSTAGKDGKKRLEQRHMNPTEGRPIFQTKKKPNRYGQKTLKNGTNSNQKKNTKN